MMGATNVVIGPVDMREGRKEGRKEGGKEGRNEGGKGRSERGRLVVVMLLMCLTFYYSSLSVLDPCVVHTHRAHYLILLKSNLIESTEHSSTEMTPTLNRIEIMTKFN
jgi:hypothetical protein